MQRERQMKIDRLTPAAKDFDLLFELTEVKSKTKGVMECRIVDDTGIIDASFNKIIDKLEVGKVFCMTNLTTQLKNNRLQIIMTNDTTTTKEADTLGFKDKANDISKKKFNGKEEQKNEKTTPVLGDTLKKQQVLIPFTKEQAEQQLRLKKQFESKMRVGGKSPDFKFKEKAKEKLNSHYKEKQNNGSKQGNEYKLKYKEKEPEQKQKRQFKEKVDYQRNKAKSLMYREKV